MAKENVIEDHLNQWWKCSPTNYALVTRL